MDRLRVGVIGVHPERGWAREAHVPAVRAVEGMELAAVATRSQDSADAAAAAFGAPAAYGDAADLIGDPGIDVVTVAASVPAHHELITAALRAGKHVLTEWPVTTRTSQTAELARLTEDRGRRTAVGLQARANRAVARAVELIGEGAIGRIVGATAYSTTAGFGRVVGEGELYLEDPATGMNLRTIQVAHTLDLGVRLAGALSSVAALSTVQYPSLRVGDGSRTHRRTLPDHVLVHGRLAGGGALAAAVVGGRPAHDTPFELRVTGEDGELTLVGGAPRGFQSGVLRLAHNGRPVPVDDPAAGLPDSVVNVASLYAALRDDIVHGTSTAPTFAHAVRLSRLIDDLTAASDTGTTVTPTGQWPA